MVIEGGGEPEAEGKSAQDLVQAKKYQQRLERLAALNEVRLQEASARKSSLATAIDPRENVDAFLLSFSQQREAVEVGLALARTNQVQPADSMKEHLEKLSLDVSAMTKSVADAAYFLPASVVKKSQNTITKLRDELDLANVECLPKKKFSFRNKPKPAKPPAPSPSVQEGIRGSEKHMKEIPSAPGKNVSCTREADSAARPSEAGGEDGADKENRIVEVNSTERIEGKSNSVFVRDAQELEGGGGELTLANLTGCSVYLRGRLTNLALYSLKNCRIFAGPVTGSVFIENVENSVLVLASHQIRIHSTTSTDFYLRVRSRPIVEYTSGNRFAPYAFVYDGVQEDLQDANLAEETGLWQKVDDFRWLRAVHSPNWSVLPVEERMPVEDGSKVVGLGIEGQDVTENVEI